MKNSEGKYHIYLIHYNDDEHAYYLVSDVNAIFEKHKNDAVMTLMKIEYANSYIKDDVVNRYQNDGTEYHLFDVKLQKLNGIGVVAESMADAIAVLDLNDLFTIESINDSGVITYIKSFDEIDTETENMRIG